MQRRYLLTGSMILLIKRHDKKIDQVLFAIVLFHHSHTVIMLPSQGSENYAVSRRHL